jgi:DNA-binding beta-propeller fold protein YncE
MINGRLVRIPRTAITAGLVAALTGIGLTSTSPAASASGTLTPPACTNQVASAPSLHGITPSTLPVPGNPFGAAVLPGGRYAVVAVDGARASDVAVFAIRGGKPRLVRLAALLAFDTADLRTSPAHALRADVRVGPQPVGVVLTDDGRFALTANSARFTAPNTPQTVSVVDTRAALAGRHALTGTIPAGQFPREFGYDPITGEVVLTNFLSNTVEVFRFPAVRCR